MSRIHDILKKAERDGGMQRTRALTSPEPVAWAGDASSTAAAVAERTLPPAPLPSPPVRPAGDRATGSGPSSVGAPSTWSGQVDGRLIAAHAPQSLAAEQYRSLRTRVKTAENGRALRTIIITSPNKGDGKSLTAANLALTMAQEFQQRVLLVDADLRRPSIHRLFGISDTPGLSDILMGGATVDDALVEVPEHRLTILPSGILPTHPAELLGSAAMRRVLDTLRTRFDRILVDMPPVAPLADVAIASSMADGILMIVRAGVTPKPAIERALSGLDMTKVLGLVLNDAGDTGAAYGYGPDGYVTG